MSTKKSGPILQRFAACWGNGDFGRLGHGAECLSEETPRLVAALADMKISQVAAGGAHTAVLAGKPRPPSLDQSNLSIQIIHKGCMHGLHFTSMTA